MHYWFGSINFPSQDYKSNTKAFNIVTDNIRLIKDNGNNIPDKSWMLYLLEIFNAQKLPVELNLICQFDNQNYFEAIFRGHNQYRFRTVLPEIGHVYHRQIIFRKWDTTIEFYLKDMNTGKDENFFLNVDKRSFSFQFFQFFTGIEWWNRINHYPYPIRFEIEVSNLMFGINDDISDPNSIIYFPIKSIRENKDGNFVTYPTKLSNVSVVNGCICYTVK